ncbi:MAG: hypothetical protein KAI79_14690, partial [Bacteroidales bacterium]|nr:hypothetical protein [Bacteroidales bacterium]
IFLIVFAHCEPNTIDEPIVETIDSCEQYAGIKNLLKVNFNGFEWQADSIFVFDYNNNNFDFLNGYTMNGVMHNNEKRITFSAILNFISEDSLGMCTIGFGTKDSTWLAIMGYKTNIIYWKEDEIQNTFCGKFVIEYDSTHAPMFGNGKLECEIINVSQQLLYLKDFEFEIDNTKEYSYNRKWYFVAVTDGNITNKSQKPIPYQCVRPELRFYNGNISGIYDIVYEYDKFAYTENGVPLTGLSGSWTINNDSKVMFDFFEPQNGYTYEWVNKWGNFYDSIYSDNTERWVEKQNNILKVLYNNGKNALIYYAKPEEYNDTLEIYLDDNRKINTNENKIYNSINNMYSHRQK